MISQPIATPAGEPALPQTPGPRSPYGSTLFVPWYPPISTSLTIESELPSENIIQEGLTRSPHVSAATTNTGEVDVGDLEHAAIKGRPTAAPGEYSIHPYAIPIAKCCEAALADRDIPFSYLSIFFTPLRRE